jgi:hypothetical protein
MKVRLVALFAAVIGLGISAHGSADAAEFTHTVTHDYAAKTSLKVVEPTGFKVSVVVDGKTFEDTVPHIFQMPEHDAYVPVTITSPEGKTQTVKIEVKAHKQAVLAFKFTPDAPAAAPAKAKENTRKHIGNIKSDTDNCTGQMRAAIRLDMQDDAGTLVHQVQLNPGELKQADLPEGKYNVRVFIYNGSQWIYRETVSKELVKDGWLFSYGCQATRRRR